MTVFSILSLRAWIRDLKEARVLLFTDNPQYFHQFLKGIEIEYHLLDQVRLKEMLGGSTYVHLRKVAVIEMVQRLHPTEPLVFLDSDTFLISDPLPWLGRFSQGKAFMHTAEYTFEEALRLYASFGQERYPQAFIQLLENETFRIGPEKLRFYSHQVSWNSGVLGLPAEMGPYLTDVYALTVNIFNATQWNTSEQIAFSLVLQSKTEILPCDHLVVHYWSARQKSLMMGRLSGLMEEGFASLDLNQKLTLVKKWAKKYAVLIPLEQSKERAINAFMGKNLLSGTKHTFHVLIHSPFDLTFLKEVAATLKR